MIIMASLIPEYEYDIFISYRQKDNKYNGWVTEFVDHLKGELESTFKNEISVYFDNDPQDGLLETHDVDASLKEKLKCLLFIPVISQTYCDPGSFAWENEFKAFVAQASLDQFGLKINLEDGYVANRVLPVRIHDLDSADIKLCELVLKGPLRGVEFIYQEPGVNRPLLADEVNPHGNLNHKIYRNQINKVANAIKEIITAMEQYVPVREEELQEVTRPFYRPSDNRRKTIISSSVLVLLLIVLGILIIPGLLKPNKQIEKSIAVLPFTNDSPGDSNKYFINGIMEEVLNNLQKIKDFRVLSRTSTDQYKDRVRPTIPEIAGKLRVNYLVEASGQKYGNKFVLRVQLIAARNERHIWGKSYNREILQTSDIISIQSEIARIIASELKASITPEEKELIDKLPTTSLPALTFYQKGRDEYQKFKSYNNREYLGKAEQFYRAALNYDTSFAKAYTGLAQVFWDMQYWGTFFSEKFLDSVLIMSNIALKYDDKLSEAYLLKGSYYYQVGRTELAEKELDKAIQFNPNEWMPYYYKANLFYFDDNINVLKNAYKAVSLNSDANLPQILEVIYFALSNAGFFEKARFIAREVFELDRDSASYYIRLSRIEEGLNNYENELELVKRACEIDSNKNVNGFGNVLVKLADAYTMANQFKKALECYEQMNKKQNAKENTNLWASHRIGFLYYKNGNIKEANYYFNKQIEYSSNEIKLGRMRSEQLFSYYDLAAVYAFLGDKRTALENLRVFGKKKIIHQWMLQLLKTDPLLDNIRNDPDFQQIVNNAETKYLAEHERVGKWLEEQGML